MSSRSISLRRPRTRMTIPPGAVAAGGIAIALALSGCVGGAGAAPTASPDSSAAGSPSSGRTTSASATPTATPQYKPADANGPAQNVPVPVKPPLADEFSKEGLVAFSKYWYEVLSYAYETGDGQALDSISAHTCTTCANVRHALPAWHQEGRWTVGGRMIVEAAQSKFMKTPTNDYQVILVVRQTAISYHRPDKTIAENHPDSKPITDILVGTYADNHWTAMAAEHVSGTAQ